MDGLDGYDGRHELKVLNRRQIWRPDFVSRSIRIYCRCLTSKNIFNWTLCTYFTSSYRHKHFYTGQGKFLVPASILTVYQHLLVYFMLLFMQLKILKLRKNQKMSWEQIAARVTSRQGETPPWSTVCKTYNRITYCMCILNAKIDAIDRQSDHPTRIIKKMFETISHG